MAMAEILVVDDDEAVASAFERFLRQEGHGCTIASNGEDAVRLAGELQPDLVVMDIRMPGVDGLETLQQMRSRYPDLYVVIMTAYGSSQTSIDAIRSGAFDYLTKPLDLDQLRGVIRQALAAREGRHRSVPAAADGHAHVKLVGDSAAMLDVYKMVGRLAAVDVPALIVGERGTGKELVGATIHQNSARRDEPFVTIDCASLPEAVVEGNTFAGAGGTLHLAGIGALPRALQARLARAIDGGPGSTESRQALAARVIASTEKDLGELVESGAFSRELHEKLALISIRLPPLRDRRDDIPLLVTHFIQRMNEQLDRAIRGADELVLRRFQEYAWPGNVGELETVVKRACIVARGDMITMEHVTESLSEARLPGRQDVESALCRAARLALQERLVETGIGAAASPFHDIVALVEATLVREALQITNGNQVKASDLLGVNRATLRKKALGE